MSYSILSEKINQPGWNWNYDGIFVYPNIPQKKLFGAIGSYANDVKPEEVIILVDDTVFGGAKEGILITNNAIYSKEIFERPKRVQFRTNLNIKPGNKGTIIIDNDIFFKATIINHQALLMLITRVSSIFEEQNESFGMEIKTHISANLANNSGSKTTSEQTQKYKSNSIFHSSKRKFLLMLQEQGVPKELTTLTSHLYDISLGISFYDDSAEHSNESHLLWVLFNDDTIFQTIIYSYYTAARLLDEHLGEEGTQDLLMPFFLSTLFYYSESKESNLPSTLKSAINPFSSFTESDIAKTFKSNVEWYFRGYHNNENGIEVARDNFKRNLWCYFSDKHNADEISFIYEPQLNDLFENHSSQKLIEIEKNIEATLIKFFNGKL